MPPDQVFYDGHCGLCHRTVLFLLTRDRDGALFRFGPLFGEVAGTVRTGTISADQAAEAGLVATATPTLGDFLVDLPGFQSTVENDGTQARRVPETVTRFAKLPLGRRLMHTVASPPVMSVFLMRVSGVTLLEQTIEERRPEYAAYKRQTNAFFPGPRRR